MPLPPDGKEAPPAGCEVAAAGVDVAGGMEAAAAALPKLNAAPVEAAEAAGGMLVAIERPEAGVGAARPANPVPVPKPAHRINCHRSPCSIACSELLSLRKLEDHRARLTPVICTAEHAH